MKCRKELNETTETIRDQHLEASKQLQLEGDVGNYGQVFKELDARIVEDCEELRSFLSAAQVGQTPRQLASSMWLILLDNRRTLCKIEGSYCSYRRETSLQSRGCSFDEQGQHLRHASVVHRLM